MTNRSRILIVSLVLLLVAPVGVSALTHDEPFDSPAEETGANATQNITFVSFQGGEIDSKGARLVAFDTETKEPVWTHDRYRKAYYDVDPLNESTVLFVAGNNTEWEAVVMNWRENVVYDRFEVPKDTHDIDYLGDDRYAIADMENHRAYVYDRSNGTAVWEFNYTENFPSSVGGEDGYSGDYTHLNDIDAHDNDSAFLVSPRNFDRVQLLNRSTNEVEWTLGAEDEYDVLFEQHNPVLIEQSPPTVLVADSENHRIVEYRKSGADWNLVWEYRGDLRWPRDADRLPNGNTLIVDSQGDRVLEVTPGRDVVWELREPKFPYDVERVRYGDEPRGPSMVNFTDSFDSARDPPQTGLLHEFDRQFEWAYDMSQWILPWWVSQLDFALLALAVGLIVTWGSYELRRSLRELSPGRSVSSRLSGAGRTSLLLTTAGLFIVAVAVGFVELAANATFDPLRVKISGLSPFILGLSFLLVFQAVTLLRQVDWSSAKVTAGLRTVHYLQSVAGLALAFKTTQLYLANEDTGPYVGVIVLLVLFCAPVFVTIVTSLVSLSRYERTPLYSRLRLGLGLPIMIFAIAVLFSGAQARYSFGTFVGPGIVLFAIATGHLRPMKTAAEGRGLQIVTYALEVIAVSILLVTTSLALGLGSTLLSLEVIGFGSLLLGYLLIERMSHGTGLPLVVQSKEKSTTAP